MTRDHIGKSRRVTRLERCDHLLVLGDRTRSFVRLVVADEADALQPRLDHLVRRREQRVA